MGLLFDGFEMPPRESSATSIRRSGKEAWIISQRIRGSIYSALCCRTPRRRSC